MKIKETLMVIAYSPLFFLIWGLLFLDSNSATQFSTFLGLLYTGISPLLLRASKTISNSKYVNLGILICPFIYAVLAFVFHAVGVYYLIDPIFVAFLTLVFVIFFNPTLNLNYLFFLSFFSYTYCFHVLPAFNDKLNACGDNAKSALETNGNIGFQNKLNSFSFESNSGDTIQLNTQKDYVLIETWHSECPPCIRAMADLQPMFDSLSSKIDHYYLFENGKKVKASDKTSIFSFKKINQPQKILIDVDNKFYDASGMASFPYFLVFNKEGILVDYISGYNADFKEEVIRKLKSIMGIN